MVGTARQKKARRSSAALLVTFGAEQAQPSLEQKEFLSAVALPFLKELFRTVLRRFGPKSPGANTVATECSSGKCACRSSARISRFPGRAATAWPDMEKAGPKMACWVAAQTMFCAILETIWVDPQEHLLLPVSDGALTAGTEFWWSRFLFGIAILAGDVLEKMWNTIDKRPHMDDHTEERTLLRNSLQRVTAQVISRGLPQLRDALIKGSARQGAALAAVHDLFQSLQMHSLCRPCGEGCDRHFQKLCWVATHPETQDFLRELRVPGCSFGCSLGEINSMPDAKRLKPTPAPSSAAHAVSNMQLIVERTMLLCNVRKLKM